MKNQRKSYLYVLLTILFWSTVSTAFKVSLNYLSPLGLLLIASITASVILLTIYIVQNKQLCLRNIKQNLIRSIIPGLLNPLLYYLILLNAYDRLRAQEAQVLNYTWAITLSILSIILLKQRFRLKDLLAMLISICGVIIISSKGNLRAYKFDNAWGSFLAISSSLVWAIYWILNMKDDRDSITKLLFNFIVGSTYLISIVFVMYFVGYNNIVFKSNSGFVYGILSACYVGIFEMGITFVLWMKALDCATNTSNLSNLIFVTPFVSLIFIWLVLGESIHPATLIGLMLIIMSNVYQKYEFKLSKKR